MNKISPRRKCSHTETGKLHNASHAHTPTNYMYTNTNVTHTHTPKLNVYQYKCSKRHVYFFASVFICTFITAKMRHLLVRGVTSHNSNPFPDI